MDFAQALARIEELLPLLHTDAAGHELFITFCTHADSIVQLGKIAEKMFDGLEVYDGPKSEYARVVHKASVAEACNAYDALMKRGDGHD